MSTKERIQDIDVLRGIAIIFVLIEHLPANLIYWQPPNLLKLYEYFNGGGGVDLFFVISGFLITKLYLIDYQQENKSLVINNALLFWYKRAVRLFPAAWFWLLATIFGALFLNHTYSFGSVKANIEGAIAALFQVANFRFMSCFTHYECGLNTIQWSLSLEQQFYFIFPFIVYFTKHRLPIFLGGMLLIQLFSESLAAPFGFRFSGFAVGALIGIFSKTSYYTILMPRFLNRIIFMRIVLFFVVLLLLATSTGKYLQLGTYNLKYNLTVFVSGILVLVASYNKSWLLPQSVLKFLLMFIGERSYSYYLCHQFCFALTRAILQPYYLQNEPDLLAMLIYIGVAALFCGLLGELSYKILEVYFKKAAQPYIKALQKKLSFYIDSHPSMTEKINFSSSLKIRDKQIL